MTVHLLHGLSASGHSLLMSPAPNQCPCLAYRSANGPQTCRSCFTNEWKGKGIDEDTDVVSLLKNLQCFISPSGKSLVFSLRSEARKDGRQSGPQSEKEGFAPDLVRNLFFLTQPSLCYTNVVNGNADRSWFKSQNVTRKPTSHLQQLTSCVLFPTHLHHPFWP